MVKSLKLSPKGVKIHMTPFGVSIELDEEVFT
jgi:hypothetical protein